MAKIKAPSTKNMPNLNWLISPSYDAEIYRSLTFDTRVTIARKKLSWFNPPHDKTAEGKFNDEWWSSILNGCPKWSDEQSVALHVSLFPDRTKKEYVDEVSHPFVDFFATVTRENATAWYHSLPDHLRRQVDKEISLRPSGAEAKRDSIYECVFGKWGDRPELPDEPKSNIDGLGVDEFFRMEVWREWVRMYDDLQLIEVVVEMAPAMQRERKMLANALGLQGSNVLPNQALGLDDVQAATIQWIQSQGQTPLEFMVEAYKNEELKFGDRLAAAAKLMDYVHRRVPVKQEIQTEEKLGVDKVDREALRKLSAKELDLLEQLLRKATD